MGWWSTSLGYLRPPSRGVQGSLPGLALRRGARGTVRTPQYLAYYSYALLALQRGLPGLAREVGGGPLLDEYAARLLEVLYAGLGSLAVGASGDGYRVGTSAPLESGASGRYTRSPTY